MRTMDPAEQILMHSIPEPNSGCWLWIGGSHERGYGCVKHGGTQYRAHRFSWSTFVGPIPTGLHVLHKCDMPACVNPSHLFLGTDDDNAKDCLRKGRTARGEKHGSRLHPERVPRGDRHGSRIHIARRPRGDNHASSKLTGVMVASIRDEAKRGRSTSSLAAQYGMAQCTISRIVARTAWKHLIT